MNKEPSHEELPFDTCMACDKKFTFARGNTFIFEYEDMPDAEHLCAICPHCSTTNTVFLGSEDVKEKYRSFGYGVHQQPVPNLPVMEMYLELYEIPLVEAQEITPRQEARVQWLGHLLANDQLTVDDFQKEGELHI